MIRPEVLHAGKTGPSARHSQHLKRAPPSCTGTVTWTSRTQDRRIAQTHDPRATSQNRSVAMRGLHSLHHHLAALDPCNLCNHNVIQADCLMRHRARAFQGPRRQKTKCVVLLDQHNHFSPASSVEASGRCDTQAPHLVSHDCTEMHCSMLLCDSALRQAPNGCNRQRPRLKLPTSADFFRIPDPAGIN